MKLYTRSSIDDFIIYREKYGVILFMLFIACLAIAVGVMYVNIDEHLENYWLAFGVFWILIGSGLLFYIPFYFSRLMKDNGAVLLKVNRNGLLVSPEINVTPVEYDWQDVSRIIITRKYIQKDSDGTTFGRCKIIIIFRQGFMGNINLIDRSIKRLWESPEGSNVAMIDCSEQDMELVQGELERLKPSAIDGKIVHYYSQVLFNYTDSNEYYEPLK